jgi:hypothetical protein
LLKQARQNLPVINAGEAVDDAYFALERRCADLYGLFAATTEAPGSEEKQRIYYHKESP